MTALLCWLFGGCGEAGSLPRPADRSGEFSGRCGQSQGEWSVESQVVLAASQVLQEDVPGDDHQRAPIGL